MTTPFHRRPWTLALTATVLVTLAACTPLPDYDTAFTLTLDPDDGDPPIVLTGASVPQPEIFADLASSGEQKDLLILIGNGDSAEPSVNFVFWRYYSDSEAAYVEQVLVSIDDTSYELEATPISGDAPVPDAFDVVAYADPDFPGSLGRITGSIAPFDFVDGTSGSIEVTLTGMDALVRASDDAPDDPTTP